MGCQATSERLGAEERDEESNPPETKQRSIYTAPRFCIVSFFKAQTSSTHPSPTTGSSKGHVCVQQQFEHTPVFKILSLWFQ